MTRMVQRTALFLCLSLAAAFAADAAECGERMYDLLKAAYPGASSETGDGAEYLRTAGAQPRWIDINNGATCKVWPASPDKTLIAVQLRHSAADDPDGYTADLEVLVADSAEPRILQRHREQEALQSDAIRITAVSLDTARYRLNETTTAFGVRIEYSGSSRPNPYGSTTLSLYAAEDGKLRQVLRSLEVEASRGEWDTHCAGEFSSLRRTVAMDAKRDHGYAGLLVSSVEQRTRNVVQGEDCTERADAKQQSRVRIAYDGREYVPVQPMHGL